MDAYSNYYAEVRDVILRSVNLYRPDLRRRARCGKVTEKREMLFVLKL